MWTSCTATRCVLRILALIKRALADTNLFIRYLERDHEAHGLAAERMLERTQLGELTLIVTPMVMAELVWTLTSFYKRDKVTISGWLLAICNTPGIEVENRGRVIQALVWFEEKNVDFIDAYHAAWLLEQDFSDVVSFDEKRFEHVDLSVPE